MHVKLKEEGLQFSSLPMSCWHINEKICLPINVDIQKLLQWKGKTCSVKIDHDKNQSSLEPQQPHEKKTMWNQINSNVVSDDNICECADTINSYHNVNSMTWRLQGKG
jgi:hypothetical protein